MYTQRENEHVSSQIAVVNATANVSNVSAVGAVGAVGAVTVLLVNDHALMREGLQQLFAHEKDIHVIGEAVDSTDVLHKIGLLRPNVVLLALPISGIDGTTLTRQITEEFPSTAVILLTTYRQREQMLQAMKHGARGYLSKSASVRDVIQAIRLVHEGGTYIEPALAGAIVSEYRRLADASPTHECIELLTAKELEIIRAIAAGMSNKEIAQCLAYSEKTVKNYLSIIFQKLHLRDRTQVAIFALRHGLLPVEE